MEALRHITLVLESILVPKPGYTNQTRVYAPDISDISPEAELKRKIIKRSLAVLDAAKERLAGTTLPHSEIMDGAESEQIEAVLATDSEKREFQELVHHAYSAEIHLAEPPAPVA